MSDPEIIPGDSTAEIGIKAPGGKWFLSYAVHLIEPGKYTAAYWIDLDPPSPPGNPSGKWESVGEYDTLEEAKQAMLNAYYLNLSNVG